CAAARCRNRSTREANSPAASVWCDRNPSTASGRAAPCKIPSQFGDGRVLEDYLRGQLETEPIFELDDQIDAARRIEAQAREFRLRVDRPIGQVESASQIARAPLADLGFGRLLRSQKDHPARGTAVPLAAGRQSGQAAACL